MNLRWKGAVLRSLMASMMLITVPVMLSCADLPAIASGPRELRFKDMDWRIKSSRTPVAPGPNRFSATSEAVWVDERGLHLTIGRDGDSWYATEVFTRQRVGYGTYTFSVDTDALSYDPAVVAGFFTWDTAPEEFNREIDIEFAAWGLPGGTKFQYVVQPYTDPSRIEVFDPKLQGRYTTHRILWTADRLEFVSYHGFVDPDSPEASMFLMNRWVFAGKPPSEGKVRFRINLWLYQGKEPRDEVHMVITDFKYEPSGK
jgi:hypothetical protein